MKRKNVNNSSSEVKKVKREEENNSPVNSEQIPHEAMQRDFNARLEQEVNERTAQLKDSHDLLQSVFDSSLNIITVFKAVRNETGDVTDFKYLITNNTASLPVPNTSRVGRLFSEVHPGIYDNGIFNRLKKVMETGERADFELYYDAENINTWFRLIAVKLDDGVVVTSENISERKKAEETIKKMGTVQQHELFKATLDAQEKERRRIAESLHNGLGQILYGAKLTLNDLRLKPGDTWQEKHQQIIQDTEKLLTEAINETRRMSHELIPTVLEDFGLKTAIEDICRQFKHVLNINCSFIGLPAKIDQYIEIAVYRIIQELVTNIIKHAEATKSSIHVEVNSYIKVTVKDNGKGFATKTGEDGIGLKTIQGNVKMLNGKLVINSTPGEGSTINITIPNKPAGV
jgi:two-component system, NarL family, sensor kinase